MRKAPCYKGGGRIKGEPEKPKTNTIDRSKYTSILSNPAPGNDDFTAQSPDAFTPDVLGANGFKYHSGTMGGKDIAYEKNGNVYLYNENPSAGNKYRLTNIGNPFADTADSNSDTSVSSPAATVAPTIDPNRKPLDLSNPNLSFDPNTNSYKNPVTGSTVNPIVEQYNKGGKVRKAPKGYAFGGKTNSYNENFNNVNEQNTVDNQTPPVPDQQPKKSGTGKAVLNQTGQVLGAYGTGYYATNPGDNKADNMRAATLGGVSQAGPIGGVVSGVAAIGDKIGAPIKAKAERTDDEGNLLDPTAAKRNAVVGSFLSPSKALATRSQYKGGWRDVSGNGYLKYLEDQSKGKINEQRQADIDAENANKFAINTNNFSSALQARDDNTIYDNSNVYKSKDLPGLLDTSGDSSQYNGKSWFQRTFANGGMVKGAGTGKSDSIKAKVVPGSFVVPAENAPVIEEIKEKVLRKAPKKANLNQKGGTEIKISNGEHLLSPEEKAEIESYGYDVDALAPDSDDNTNLKNGGLTSEKANIMLKDNQANGKPLTTAQKKYFGWVAGGSKADGGVVGYDKGGKVKTQSERDKIKAEEDALLKARNDKNSQSKVLSINNNTLKKKDDASKELIRADTYLKSLEKEYEDYDKRVSSGNKLIGESDERIRANKKAMLDKIDQANQVRESANQQYKQVTGKSAPTIGDSSKGGLDYLGGSNKKNTFAPPTDASVTDFTPTNTVSSGKRAPSRKANTTSVSADNLSAIPTSAIPYSAQEESLYGDRTPAEIARMNQVPVYNADTKSNEVVPAGNTVAPSNVSPTDNVNNKKNKFDYSNILGNAINYGIPAAQTAIGLKQLKAAGNRPVDQLDSDYINSLNQTRAGVQQANDQAKYGFTGAELTALNNQNNQLTSAGRYAARNFSGGSSGNALNMERSVINDSFGRALNTKVSDNALKMDKQQEAFNRQNILNSQIQDKQDRLRTYFGDNLEAWHQKTQSAAGLLNSGLTNALDSYRADQRLKNFNNQMSQTNNFTNP